MLRIVPPTDCLQAREAVSARLDGELGELDAARLEQHLAACGECRAFAADADGVARMLRTTALEPAPTGLLAERSRRRIAGPAAVAAATLVVAVAAGASFFMGELIGSRGSAQHGTATATAATVAPGLVAMLHGSAHPRAQTGRVIAL